MYEKPVGKPEKICFFFLNFQRKETLHSAFKKKLCLFLLWMGSVLEFINPVNYWLKNSMLTKLNLKILFKKKGIDLWEVLYLVNSK